ncbi:MAG TPA: FHA domain-containing protein [Polyangium sp.]|nr:FHA domain-containing protein [Polyangium sp.]
MAVKITVRQADALEPEADKLAASALDEASLVFDMPRIFIGRGDSADLRLPDPSVSARHASLRQRGNEIVIVDEGSTNGTALDSVLLAPQSPRVLRSGDLVRVGRVWLEITIDPLLMGNANPTSAKALALGLITRALATQGEDGSPRLVVTNGPDEGKSLDLSDSSRRYVIGRAQEVDLVLEDETAARRHVELGVKGDSLVVKDLGSNTANLEGAVLGKTDTAWKVGQTLKLGQNSVVFDYPAAVALAELSRCADEVMQPGDVPPRPRTAADESPAPPEVSEPLPMPSESQSMRSAGTNEASWSFTDALVFLLAAAVLLLSILGFVWLLRN